MGKTASELLLTLVEGFGRSSPEIDKATMQGLESKYRKLSKKIRLDVFRECQKAIANDVLMPENEDDPLYDYGWVMNNCHRILLTTY